MSAITVSVLAEDAWTDAIGTAAELPFGRTAWLAMGLAQHPELRLVPVSVRAGPVEVLVPLCLDGAGAGQIGCLGYGGIYPRDPTAPVPRFGDLAELLCGHFGLHQLSTLLPPPEVAEGLDRVFAGTPTTPARATYLLPIEAGTAAGWAGLRGNVRTAVRRARALGLTAHPLAREHGAELLRLYAETLARHGLDCPLEAAHVDAMLTEIAAGSAAGSIVLDRAGTALAGTLFGLAGNRGYHVMQASSAAGQLGNAGHLALWSAIVQLIDGGVRLLDLGSAGSEGQRRFKLAWGAIERPTRAVVWQARRSVGATR